MYGGLSGPVSQAPSGHCATRRSSGPGPGRARSRWRIRSALGRRSLGSAAEHRPAGRSAGRCRLPAGQAPVSCSTEPLRLGPEGPQRCGRPGESDSRRTDRRPHQVLASPGWITGRAPGSRRRPARWRSATVPPQGCRLGSLGDQPLCSRSPRLDQQRCPPSSPPSPYFYSAHAAFCCRPAPTPAGKRVSWPCPVGRSPRHSGGG